MRKLPQGFEMVKLSGRILKVHCFEGIHCEAFHGNLGVIQLGQSPKAVSAEVRVKGIIVGSVFSIIILRLLNIAEAPRIWPLV